MRRVLMTTCAVVALAAPAHAEGILSVNWGLAWFGDSGVSTVDKLERDEIATSNVKGIEVGYQSGWWRATLGYEHTDADGDWGVHQSDGKLARQTVQISASRFTLGGEVDLPVSMGALKPFVGAGVSLNLNRPENASVTHDSLGCVSDNGDTMSFGYHGRLGIGYDMEWGRVSVFGQYTDRGKANTTCDGGDQAYEGYSVRLRDVSMRLGVTVRF